MGNVMANDIIDLFRAVYPDGPSTSPDQPSKPRIREELGGGLQTIIDYIRGQLGVGLQLKDPVRAASVVNVTLASISNGTSFGGVTVATGNRIGAFGQTTQSQNGIYVVQASGAPVRALDADASSEMTGMMAFVSEGTNAGRVYACLAPPPIVVGTTALPFYLMIDTASLNTTLSALVAEVTAARYGYPSLSAHLATILKNLSYQETSIMGVIEEVGKLKSLSVKRGVGPMIAISGAALQKLNKSGAAGMRMYMPPSSSLKLSLVPTPKKTRGWDLAPIAGGPVNEGKFGYGFKGRLSGDSAALDTVNGTFTIEATVRLPAIPAETLVAAGSTGQAWIGLNSQGFAIASYGSGAAVTVVGAANIADGADHVIALVLSGTGAKLFVDGVQVATSATTYTASQPSIDYTVPFGIGWLGGNDTANFWTGIVSDVILWSTAAYTAGYTVRTAPPTKAAGMRALWRGSDLTDDARELAANSLFPVRAGSPVQAAPVAAPTFGPGKFYGTKALAAAHILGAGSQGTGVLEAPPAAVDVADGSFAVEAFVRLPSFFPGTATYIAVGINNVCWIGSFDDGFVRATWGTGGAGAAIATTVSIRDNQWHHVALSVGASGGRLYVDGVLAGSGATTFAAAGGIASPTTPFGIGRIGGVNNFQWPGQIAEVVTWDSDKYTANFTPPTAPRSVVGGMTSLFPLDGDGNNVIVGGSMSLSADTTGPNWDETLDGMDVWVSDVVGAPMYRQY